METAEKITETLPQFTGNGFWFHSDVLPGISYTEGVKYLAGATEAYWLVSAVSLSQRNPDIRRYPFQVWKLIVNPDKSGVVTCDDGNGNQIVREEISYTDFPLPEITLWLEGNVLILPSEH